MLIGLVLLLAVAPTTTVAPHNEIVVVGRSLQQLKDDLDRCIARHCPAREDVIASVRYAEAQFRVARYQDARRTLERAIERDKGAGRQEPYAIAALYEATATVSRHDGEQAAVAKAIDARVRLLKETTPPDGADLLRAEMDQADLIYQRHGPLRGLELYRALEARARAAGQPVIAATAVLRQAQAQKAIGNPSVARRLADSIIAEGDGVPAGFRLAAYAFKTRLPHGRGDTTDMNDLRTALARIPQAKPLLIYAPQPPTPADTVDLDYYNNSDNVTRDTDWQNTGWTDIGYTIRPDGTVDNPEPLRGTLGKDDTGQIIAAMKRRQYAAFSPGNGDQYRVERWTLTADYATPQGSLIRRRVVNPHYEVLDVTTDPAPTKSNAASS